MAERRENTFLLRAVLLAATNEGRIVDEWTFGRTTSDEPWQFVRQREIHLPNPLESYGPHDHLTMDQVEPQEQQPHNNWPFNVASGRQQLLLLQLLQQQPRQQQQSHDNVTDATTAVQQGQMTQTQRIQIRMNPGRNFVYHIYDEYNHLEVIPVIPDEGPRIIPDLLRLVPTSRPAESSSGVPQATIDGLQSYEVTHEVAAGRKKKNTFSCSICLGTVEVGQKVRVLTCQHEFHAPCVDKWLLEKATCPMCRSAVHR